MFFVFVFNTNNEHQTKPNQHQTMPFPRYTLRDRQTQARQRAERALNREKRKAYIALQRQRDEDRQLRHYSRMLAVQAEQRADALNAARAHAPPDREDKPTNEQKQDGQDDGQDEQDNPA